MQQNPAVNVRKFQWLLKFDLALHEKPKKLPVWLTVSNDKQYHQRIFGFYCSSEQIQKYLPHYAGMENKVVARISHLEVFGDENPTAILFDYDHRDLLSNAAVLIIPLQELKEKTEV